MLMTKNIDLRKRRRENLLYRVYVCEESTDLTWSDQVLN
jgi:hypothetical protein